jgi:hypothetical protein
MDVLPLVATVFGAVIALAGTLLTDFRRDRQQRSRDNQQVRRETYVSFALALNAAHDGLRQLGDSFTADSDRPDAANRVLSQTGVYGARERLLMIATKPVAAAGEAAFERLGDIRRAVRDGAGTSSERYHDAYHPWAESVWRFRMAVRGELGQPALTPAGGDESDWSERRDCQVCAGSGS